MLYCITHAILYVYVMTSNTASYLHQAATEFLEQDAQQRLHILKQYGIARYTFLLQMRLNEANIICVTRYLQNPRGLKFPNLIEADLSGLVLDGVNLIRGNLSGANLNNTSLVKADMIFVNFTSADLRNANLSGATLNETIWQDTLVTGCQLDNTIGLTQTQRQDLLSLGAKL
ncbi:hypothetical protein NIES2101_01220 [Calothrix sp. HK-06]|nr:hypothetical protein NIES2101_01220 [Calothrix sp. HK-06]